MKKNKRYFSDKDMFQAIVGGVLFFLIILFVIGMLAFCIYEFVMRIVSQPRITYTFVILGIIMIISVICMVICSVILIKSEKIRDSNLSYIPIAILGVSSIALGISIFYASYLRG